MFVAIISLYYILKIIPELKPNISLNIIGEFTKQNTNDIKNKFSVEFNT